MAENANVPFPRLLMAKGFRVGLKGFGADQSDVDRGRIRLIQSLASCLRAVEKSDELAVVGRGHVVVDSVDISHDW